MSSVRRSLRGRSPLPTDRKRTGHGANPVREPHSTKRSALPLKLGACSPRPATGSSSWSNEHGETALSETGSTSLPEGTFTTAPAPTPGTETGSYSALSPTSATITGMVTPDGAPRSSASKSASTKPTQHDTASSPPAPPAPEAPPSKRATTSYRPRARRHIHLPHHHPQRLHHQPRTHPPSRPDPVHHPRTTSVLTLPGIESLSPVPAISFPIASKGPPPHATPTRAQLLAKALKTCAKKPKRIRATCRRQAQKRYGPQHRKKK